MIINLEKILDNSRLQYLSLSARISLIAILVMEIRKSQGYASVMFGTWNSFCCVLFLTKLTAEFGKVFYKKVVENFISFYELQLHWIKRMGVTTVLLRCCFFAREEFQISCPYPYTRVPSGCQNYFILVSSSKRMCKLCLVSPSLYLFKGVAKLKNLQVEVSYVLVAQRKHGGTQGCERSSESQ